MMEKRVMEIFLIRQSSAISALWNSMSFSSKGPSGCSGPNTLKSRGRSLFSIPFSSERMTPMRTGSSPVCRLEVIVGPNKSDGISSTARRSISPCVTAMRTVGASAATPVCTLTSPSIAMHGITTDFARTEPPRASPNTVDAFTAATRTSVSISSNAFSIGAPSITRNFSTCVLCSGSASAPNDFTYDVAMVPYPFISACRTRHESSLIASRTNAFVKTQHIFAESVSIAHHPSIRPTSASVAFTRTDESLSFR
mmetsp:Transcript_7114/g.17975  ORF Transcript_7114/g.17975 Transcript_7114/m.17975 type:complete len:254 (+) Transcript_7114:1172-1933(+)